ncbi:hypothetical protein J6590_005009 [Homalodisca vitripennis]|nr:hypothetical protein J6590_005009 [Homalodisca vitripennis]
MGRSLGYLEYKIPKVLNPGVATRGFKGVQSILSRGYHHRHIILYDKSCDSPDSATQPARSQSAVDVNGSVEARTAQRLAHVLSR